MATIVPTITTDDANVMNQQLANYAQFAKRIHVDFSDSSFAATTTAPLEEIRAPEGVALDIHLMTAKPSTYIQQLLALRPQTAIFHAEASEDLVGIATQLKNANIKVGIALLKGTFPGRVAEVLKLADYILIFAGSLGVQGGTADMLQTEKIPLVQKINEAAEIAWDGGANLTNVRALAHSGADIINVGAAIAKAEDYTLMYQALTVESEKKGVLL